MKGKIRLQRIYEFGEKVEGYRILVDRLWPRGLTKEKASIDLWLKEIAPSNDLRKWFHQDPENYIEFKKRYSQELDRNPRAVQTVHDILKKQDVVLLYGRKDKIHNQAAVLKEYLENKFGKE
ncbi:MAG: DUF488 family protein [Calditrichota bacterium]